MFRLRNQTVSVSSLEAKNKTWETLGDPGEPLNTPVVPRDPRGSPRVPQVNPGYTPGNTPRTPPRAVTWGVPQGVPRCLPGGGPLGSSLGCPSGCPREDSRRSQGGGKRGRRGEGGEAQGIPPDWQWRQQHDVLQVTQLSFRSNLRSEQGVCNLEMTRND